MVTAIPAARKPAIEMLRNFLSLCPAVTAMAYPLVLQAFHAAILPGQGVSSASSLAGATALLIVAFAMPLSGLVFAYWLTREPQLGNRRARRLAYASIAAPPLFVLLGVTRGLLGIHLPEFAMWVGVWALAAVYGWSGRDKLAPVLTDAASGTWRVAHGISAALITCYVLFHLTNHLFGLAGPDTHAAIMKAGRAIYRSTFIEPLLVGLLLFQVASGIRLAWRWSGVGSDVFRIFQIGSGAYLAAFILTHLNSALVSARAVHKIDTNWAWASGAPAGLIHDAWDIRLLPHYALGVFFVVGHLFSGLRVVVLAHGASTRVANRIWAFGLSLAAVIAATIICALCGLRL
jgi:hypothetical protein